jgi:lipoate-protein ligase A
MAGTQDRYEALCAVLLGALERIGIEARIGELPGEWCPGAWSVLVGDVKVGGLAQRMIRGGAWAEAVIVVSGSSALRAALDGVQRALGVDWAPSTLGAIEDIAPGVTPAQLTGALIAAAGVRWPARPAPVPAELWRQAQALRTQHVL